MKGFFLSVAAGVTVVFVTRYLSSREALQPTSAADMTAALELESETFA